MNRLFRNIALKIHNDKKLKNFLKKFIFIFKVWPFTLIIKKYRKIFFIKQDIKRVEMDELQHPSASAEKIYNLIK